MIVRCEPGQSNTGDHEATPSPNRGLQILVAVRPSMAAFSCPDTGRAQVALTGGSTFTEEEMEGKGPTGDPVDGASCLRAGSRSDGWPGRLTGSAARAKGPS